MELNKLFEEFGMSVKCIRPARELYVVARQYDDSESLDYEADADLNEILCSRTETPEIIGKYRLVSTVTAERGKAVITGEELA